MNRVADQAIPMKKKFFATIFIDRFGLRDFCEATSRAAEKAAEMGKEKVETIK